MLNVLKHLNNYSSSFKYKNTHKIKSFRKNSSYFFLKLMYRSFFFYLNNLSANLMLSKSKILCSVLLSMLHQRHNLVLRDLNVNNSLVFLLYTTYIYNDSFSTYNELVYNSLIPKQLNFYFLFFNAVFLEFVLYGFTVFSLSKLAALPTTRKLFTLLRSPHTDKKSREQFTLAQLNKLFVDSNGFNNILLSYLYAFEFNSFQLKNTIFTYYY